MTAPTVYTAATLAPAHDPTIYFIGVTTGSSSIQRVFPAWAAELGLENARLVGIDLPLHASSEEYRSVVRFIANDPLSLGALVTTHKIDLYRACQDMFDVIDPLAILMHETSCISKTPVGLVCHAKDPISSGLALDSFVPDGHWRHTGAQAFSMGAGGSTIAISWHLSRPSRGADRPSRIIVSNRSPERLDHLREIHDHMETNTPFEYVLAPDPTVNDSVLDRLDQGSLVVNATGLGKDAPGSPLTSTGRFPIDGLAWELNYRGDLVFLEQARAQERERRLAVVDGWTYFLHGWTQVISEVFHVKIATSGPSFDRLSEIAHATRRTKG